MGVTSAKIAGLEIFSPYACIIQIKYYLCGSIKQLHIMKNLDITIVAAQGAGKTTLAQGIFKIMGIAPERVAELEVLGCDTCEGIVEELRGRAADAVVFDVALDANLSALAGAVESYREIMHRKVAAVYCIQATQKDFINYKS